MRRARGFSLIEVLVSVLVVAVGLLGVSKMQAAGVSNSQIARTRSLVALQASSLAALMRGNPGYWGNAPATKVDFSGKTVTDSKGELATFRDCEVQKCVPTELAAYDLSNWAAQMSRSFPNYAADVQCTSALGQPNHCLINIKWQEKYVAVNKATAAGSTRTAVQQFTLGVEL